MVELVEFAKTGNLARIRQIVLEGGQDVNFRCPPDGSTALYWAACGGHVTVCDWLIDNGAKIDMMTTKSGSTPLHGAADRGHYDCAALLLRRGGCVDRQTMSNGDTALHLAAYRGDLVICRLLLDHGARTSVANKQGRTALEESQIKNHFEVSRLLLQHNLNRDKQELLSRETSEASSLLCEFPPVSKSLEGGKRISPVQSELHPCCRSPDDAETPSHASIPCSEGATWVSSSDQGDSGKASLDSFAFGLDDSDQASWTSADVDSYGLVRHLRMKILGLKSYAETLQVELTLRDDQLERMRRENALLRRHLEMEAPQTPSTTKAEPERSAGEELGGVSPGTAAFDRELDRLKQRRQTLETVVYGVNREGYDCN